MLYRNLSYLLPVFALAFMISSEARGQCAPSKEACEFLDPRLPFCFTPAIGPEGAVGLPYDATLFLVLGRTVEFEGVTLEISRVDIEDVRQLPDGLSIAFNSGNPDDGDPPAQLVDQWSIPGDLSDEDTIGIFGCAQITGVPETATDSAVFVEIDARVFVRVPPLPMELDINDFLPDGSPEINPLTLRYRLRIRDTSNLFVSAGPDRQLCTGDTLTLATTTNVPDAEFTWTPAEGLSDPSAQTPQAFPLQTTTYTVTASTDENQVGDTITITVNERPALVATPVAPDCRGVNAAVRLEVSGGAPPYQLYLNSSFVRELVETGEIELPVPGPGDWYAEADDANECSARADFTVEAPTSSGFAFRALRKRDAGMNNNGVIVATMKGGVPPFEYSLNDGADWQSERFFRDLEPGAYEVIGRDAEDCEIRKVITIR